MKRLLCWLGWHKYQKKWTDRFAQYIYGTTCCMRCGEYKYKNEKIYFSGTQTIDDWSSKKLFRFVYKGGKKHKINRKGTWICTECLGVDGCMCALKPKEMRGL